MTPIVVMGLVMISIVFSIIISTVSKLVISKWQFIILSIILSLLLCLISFFLKPIGESSMDLFRYFLMLDDLKDNDISYAFENFDYNGNYFTTLIFFIVSRFNYYGLLPLIATAISLACINIIIFDVLKEKNDSNAVILSICLVFSNFFFLTLMTTVRSPIAICLVSLALYRDLYKKKLNLTTMLLYFIAALTHYQAIIIILIRIISIFKTRIFSFLFIIYALVLKLLANTLDLAKLIPFSEIGVKIKDYLNLEYPDKRAFVAFIGIFIVYIVFYILYIKLKDKNNTRIKLTTIRNLICFVGGSIIIPHVFIRTLNVLSLIMLPIVIEILNSHETNNYLMYSNYKVSALSRSMLKLGLAIITLGMMYYQLVGYKAWIFAI